MTEEKEEVHNVKKKVIVKVTVIEEKTKKETIPGIDKLDIDQIVLDKKKGRMSLIEKIADNIEEKTEEMTEEMTEKMTEKKKKGRKEKKIEEKLKHVEEQNQDIRKREHLIKEMKLIKKKFVMGML